MRSDRRRQLPAAAFAGLLLVTSLLPVPESAGQRLPALLGVGLDKWVHAASYAVLTGLLAWGWDVRRLGPAVAVTGLAVAFGAGVELLQGLVPSRGTDVVDLGANAAGAAVAAVAAVAWLLVSGSNGD